MSKKIINPNTTAKVNTSVIAYQRFLKKLFYNYDLEMMRIIEDDLTQSIGNYYEIFSENFKENYLIKVNFSILYKIYDKIKFGKPL